MAPATFQINTYNPRNTIFLTGSNITGSGTNYGEVTIRFSKIPNAINVTNNGDVAILYHFDSRANPNVINHGHYGELVNNGDAITLNTQATAIYLSNAAATGTGSFRLLAELSPDEHKGVLSGSGIND